MYQIPSDSAFLPSRSMCAGGLKKSLGRCKTDGLTDDLTSAKDMREQKKGKNTGFPGFFVFWGGDCCTCLDLFYGFSCFCCLLG